MVILRSIIVVIFIIVVVMRLKVMLYVIDAFTVSSILYLIGSLGMYTIS